MKNPYNEDSAAGLVFAYLKAAGGSATIKEIAEDLGEDYRYVYNAVVRDKIKAIAFTDIGGVRAVQIAESYESSANPESTPEPTTPSKPEVQDETEREPEQEVSPNNEMQPVILVLVDGGMNWFSDETKAIEFAHENACDSNEVVVIYTSKASKVAVQPVIVTTDLIESARKCA